jgi:hypothetical protein
MSSLEVPAEAVSVGSKSQFELRMKLIGNHRDSQPYHWPLVTVAAEK